MLCSNYYSQVRRTETVWNNLNPSWAVLYIPTTELCDDNFQLPLTIEVFDEDRNSRNDLIGRVELTLSDLQNLANTSSPVILTKGPKNRGQLLVTECQIEAPSSERERKESLTAYPPSRRESTYSMLGEFAHSRTDLELQADAHQLLGQGQEHCPAYQPIPQYNYNPAYQHVQPPPAGLPPYQPAQGGPYPTPSPMGFATFPGNFPPTIPEDPTDTRPSYAWT